MFHVMSERKVSVFYAQRHAQIGLLAQGLQLC